jgi:hypothetical protein
MPEANDKNRVLARLLPVELWQLYGRSRILGARPRDVVPPLAALRRGASAVWYLLRLGDLRQRADDLQFGVRDGDLLRRRLDAPLVGQRPGGPTGLKLPSPVKSTMRVSMDVAELTVGEERAGAVPASVSAVRIRRIVRPPPEPAQMRGCSGD